MKYVIWGDIVFGLMSYKEHKEDLEFSYARHETIFPPSSYQYMGGENKKISCSVRLHNSFCDPLKEYNNLIEQAIKGEAYDLILAEQMLGKYIIEKCSSALQQVDAWGRPVAIDIDIEFTEFIEKKIQTRQIKTKKRNKKRAVKSNPAKAKYNIITQNKNGQNYTKVEKTGVK
jgi:phage protein U